MSFSLYHSLTVFCDHFKYKNRFMFMLMCSVFYLLLRNSIITLHSVLWNCFLSSIHKTYPKEGFLAVLHTRENYHYLICVVIMSMWSSIKHFYCLVFYSTDNYFLIRLDLLDVVLVLKLINCFLMHLRQANLAFEQFALTELTNNSCVKLLWLAGTWSNLTFY